MTRYTVRKVVTTVGVMLAGAGASLVTMTMTAAPAQAAPAAQVATSTLQTQLVTFTNNTRVRAGCKALPVDSRLLSAARRHSAYQARTNKMSHVGAGGSTFIQRGVRAGYAHPHSENVAYGYRTASETMKGWMNS
ncbi:CAP domain-containing protein, partial [Actinoplanes sp. NPDC026623]|uniref:CAP domain-containing protein n=1 Tax=Actinoplanes sp. NPDC026623 TaxID=3155610 RepID=UPI0034011E00